MLRISKLSDYGILVMAYVAETPRHWQSAAEIAIKVGLPAPTVIKVLKILTQGNLLESRRGALGGYRLAGKPTEITLERILIVLEEPLTLVACIDDQNVCTLATSCRPQNIWKKVNQALRWTLAGITLEEIVTKKSSPLRH